MSTPANDPRHTALGAILLGALIGTVGVGIRYGVGVAFTSLGVVIVLAGLASLVGGRRG